ncbi:MAG: hypothetical protein PHX04_03375 [Bacilli bacterium]|nr:hypothetical protein [Bacilli bacterium]
MGTLSNEQFSKLCKKYENYQNNNEIDDDKIVHMCKSELDKYNPKLVL